MVPHLEKSGLFQTHVGLWWELLQLHGLLYSKSTEKGFASRLMSLMAVKTWKRWSNSVISDVSPHIGDNLGVGKCAALPPLISLSKHWSCTTHDFMLHTFATHAHLFLVNLWSLCSHSQWDQLKKFSVPTTQCCSVQQGWSTKSPTNEKQPV